MGGTGDYFGVADTVIMMDSYIARDVTNEAHALAHDVMPEGSLFPSLRAESIRRVEPESLNPRYQNKSERVQALDRRLLRYGATEIDLSRIEQLVDNGQLTAIGYLISHLYSDIVVRPQQQQDIVRELREVFNRMGMQGLDTLPPFIMGTLAMPRFFELVATVNRMRNLRLIEQPD
jgi:predicted ABC-class ATPase